MLFEYYEKNPVFCLITIIENINSFTVSLEIGER